MFVDATFGCVPKPFYQVLIVMVFVSSLEIYVPTCYILMTGKTHECYWQAFNWLCSEVPRATPKYIGVDFEINFFTVARDHFPGAELIGCKFHFKQAILKKLKEGTNIKSSQWLFAMKKGVIDLLMVIPKAQLEQGIEFVRKMIIDHISQLEDFTSGDVKLWDEFWEGYFKS